MQQRFDYIMAGGGAAGRSLAYHMIASPLAGARILIVDPEPKLSNDRTWCFWSPDPTPFDQIVYRRWPTLDFVCEDFSLQLDLAPYDYRVIRGIDFYEHTTSALKAAGVEFLQARVDQIEDHPDHATVTADGTRYRANWVFDSRWDAGVYRGQDPRYHYLQQHFLGWVIRCNSAGFDTTRATMFDLRTAQNGIFRFVYTLPFSPSEAMVEYTIFSAELLPPPEYRAALSQYIETHLGLHDYQILEEESCIIPMTDQPFAREGGKRIMRIGTRGGRVKASSGYAFLRIHNDSAAIVRSLLQSATPFHGRRPPARYRTFDSLLLQILYRRGEIGARVFSDLFRKNPVQRIFGFLDETGSIAENIALMASVPWWPFIKAWIKLRVTRRV